MKQYNSNVSYVCLFPYMQCRVTFNLFRPANIKYKEKTLFSLRFNHKIFNTRSLCVILDGYRKWTLPGSISSF